MSKIWIKENRDCITPLHQFGLQGITLNPGAIRRMIRTPGLQKAIDAKYIVEVLPVFDEKGSAITGFKEGGK